MSAKDKKLEQRELEFLKGLTELSMRTKISICGCGCCDSPYLGTLTGKDFKNQNAKYELKGGQVKWNPDAKP